MNVLFIHSALDEADLTAQEFRVYCNLSRRAGKGEAFPSLKSISEVCNVSRKTVIDAIKELEIRRMIIVSRGFGKANRYTLTKQSLWFKPVSNEIPVSNMLPVSNETLHQ